MLFTPKKSANIGQSRFLNGSKMKKYKIIVVDDQSINRMLLTKILENRYTVLQAENGLEAWRILEREKESIQAVLLDLIMPVMDGYAFLEKIKHSPFSEIPVIVASQAEGKDSELKALKMGATDFITKPYHPTIILQRLINTIAMRENAILKNTSERDYLTKLYNKETFYEKVNALITEDKDTTYSIIYFDIERFKVVNDFFGEQKGDELLIYLADSVRSFSQNANYIAARLNADCYCVCMPHDKAEELRFANYMMSFLEDFPISLKLKINFGVFIIEDTVMSVSVMCDRANLALKNIVGKYDSFIEYYNGSLHEKFVEEQQIVNEMNTALREGQFVVYIQPKFDLNTFSTIGVETLVRWKHPVKGLIPPIKFIPVFEKNGFIIELDMFIFEEVCKTLRSLLDKNIPVVPFSVNLSRADIYKPDLCEFIVEVMTRNNIDHSLIEFEITETSYTQDSEQLILVINKLRELGFSVSMDDFGTGYSSLNMLSEVPVDLLKIDMRFLKNFSETDVKSKNIIHFIVYMAKWLNLPVIAEGVETLEQVEYLRSIGCYNGQGFFFSKPFPIEEYETRVNNVSFTVPEKNRKDDKALAIKDLCSGNSTFNQIFNLFTSALAIIELRAENLEILRVNSHFYDEIIENSQEFITTTCHALDFIVPEDREKVLQELKGLDENKNWIEFVVRVKSPKTHMIFWNMVRISYLQQTFNSKVFIMQLRNVTEFKNKELICELQEDRMNAVLEFSQSSIIDVNFIDKKIRFNSILGNSLGLSKQIFDYQHEIKENYELPFEQKEELLAMFADMFAGKEQEKPILASVIRQASSRTWYELKYKLLFLENEPKLGVVYCKNETHKVISKEIYEREIDFRNSIIATHMPYIEIELDTKKVLRHSRYLLGRIGYMKEHSVDEFFARIGNTLVHPDEKERFLQLMSIYSLNLLVAQKKKISFEFRYLAGKDFKWACFNLSLAKHPETEAVSAFCYVEELGDWLHHLDVGDFYLKRDIETGLYTENIFERILTDYFEVFEGGQGALFYISLSKEFAASTCPKKSSNYSVVAMSNILREFFRNDDIVAKINELDFAVLVQSVADENTVRQRAGEICSAMNEYNKRDFSGKVIGNIGCIMLKEQNTYTIAMKKAKIACEHAAFQGENTSYLLNE